MRPMWLWGSWATTQEIETHSDAQIAWYQHISHRDTRALAAVVMGHILEEVAQFQDDRSATEPTTWPRDSDFRAIAEIWPTLSAPHQRLAKELILAMSSRPS
nr:hypothetical protein [uncultured bacterium]